MLLYPGDWLLNISFSLGGDCVTTISRRQVGFLGWHVIFITVGVVPPPPIACCIATHTSWLWDSADIDIRPICISSCPAIEWLPVICHSVSCYFLSILFCRWPNNFGSRLHKRFNVWLSSLYFITVTMSSPFPSSLHSLPVEINTRRDQLMDIDEERSQKMNACACLL